MPGMMETVLNIGLNDASVAGLAAGGRRRALRLGLLPPADPDVRQDRAGHRRRARSTRRSRRPSTAKGVSERRRAGRRRPASAWSSTFKAIVARADRPRLPAGPARADGPGDPRRLRLLEHRAGQALPAPGAHPARPGHRRQHLRHGLRQPRPGLAAPASPSPATRPPAHSGVYGDYLPNAQGEDVVAGIRNTLPLAELERLDKRVVRRADARSWRRSRRTTGTCATSSSPSSAASCGCCRPGSASAPPAAAFRIAAQLVDEGLIDHGRGARAGSPAPSWRS